MPDLSRNAAHTFLSDLDRLADAVRLAQQDLIYALAVKRSDPSTVPDPVSVPDMSYLAAAVDAVEDDLAKLTQKGVVRRG